MLKHLVEQQLTVGIGLASLSVVAFLSWIRSPRRPLLRSVPILTVLGLAAFFCSLSPEWQIGDRALPRLSEAVYEILPMFRAYARFGLVVILTATVLAGIGFVSLLERRSRTVTGCAVLALAVAAIELAPFPPWRWHDVLPTAAHRWLNDMEAAEGSSIVVLDCVSIEDPAEATVVSLFRHEIHLLGRSQDCGEPGLARRLAADRTSHVITRAGTRASRWLAGPGAVSGLTELEVFHDSTVYRVDASPPRLTLEILDGFYRREYKEEISFRWMREEGVLLLKNHVRRPVPVELALVLHAFPDTRRLAVDLGDQQIAELTVGREPAWVRLPPFELTFGIHQLRFRALESEAIPDLIDGKGDRRRLTVALGDWRIEESDSPLKLGD
jgi:hypothetical protein